MTDGLDADKLDPRETPCAALDALDAGLPEALIDEFTLPTRTALGDDHSRVYPKMAEGFAAWNAAG